MKTYNKLVRDKIPKIIKESGGKCKHHVANINEFECLLYDKLIEESNELAENFCAEEIADVLEVIETIAKIKGISLNDIREQKIKKKNIRGGFQKRIVLEKATEIKG